MNIEEAIRIVDQAISGEPNTCLSEHSSRLKELREWLSAGNPAPSPPFVADAPRATTPRRYLVEVGLSGHVTAENEEDAYDQGMQLIENRDGLDIDYMETHEETES